MDRERAETDIFGAFVRSAPDAILSADPETGEIVAANEAAEALFERSRAELIGLHQSELHPADEAERYRRMFEEHIATGPAVISEFEDGSPVYIVTGTGEKIPVEINAWSIETPEGERFQGVFRDISDRLARERELDLYREAIESSVDPMAAVGEDYRYLFCNEAYRETFDLGDREVVGLTVAEVLGEATFTEIESHLERVLDGESLEIETTRDAGEGDTREYQATYYPLTDRSGAVYGVVGSLHDVTERNRYQRELERRNDQLRVLNRIIRHDIRNDMNVALGWAGELDSHVDPAGRPMLERIESTSKHVIDLTKTVRDFLEVLGTEDRPPLEPTDLRQHLQSELDKRRSIYPDAEFSVVGEIPEVTVRANELLSSVFRNLLNNAVQHNDTETPGIEITVETTDELVQVRIADNGPGIPDARKPDIFGRGEVGLEDPGVGIGLYLVETLVTDFGGTVSVEDNNPEGAVFTVELPRA